MKHFKGKKFLATSAIALILGICSSQSANAQAIDYSSLEELFGQPVTTSANGSPQVESEVPLNMEILTQEDIERTGARSIPEVLRFVPGVNVRQYAFGQYEVGIRGYNQPNSERILVLLNGRQVYLDFFGQVVWENIPVEMAEIKQIEVVKGPNTALFGFNAVSGVINIITYNPLYDDVGDLKLRGGTSNLSEASAVKTFKFSDRAAAKISAGGFDAEEFDDFEESGGAVTEDIERRSALVDIWGQITDNTQAQFEASINNYDRNEEIVTRTAGSTDYETVSIRGRVISDTKLGIWDMDVYHNNTRARLNLLIDEFTDDTALFEVDNSITVAKLSNTFKLGANHTFRLATEYRAGKNIYENNDGQLDQGSDLTYDIYGISSLWDYTVTPKVSTSVALRFDHFDLDKDGATNDIFVNPAGGFPLNTPGITEEDLDRIQLNEFSYNLGAVYEATEKDTFRVTAARGVDLPSFTEFGLQFLSTTGGVATNPALGLGGAPALTFIGDPETDSSIVHNFEIGYNRDIEKINGALNASIFYQYNDDMQAFGAEFQDASGGGGFDISDSTISNIGDSEAYGIELGLEGKYQEKVDWAFSYAYIEIEDDLDNFGNNPVNTDSFSSPAQYEDSVVNHTITAHLGYTLNDWRFDLFGQYLTSFDDQQENVANGNSLEGEQLEIDDEFILNANIAWDVTDNLTWSVSGTSIAGDTEQTSRGEIETLVYTTIGIKF